MRISQSSIGVFAVVSFLTLSSCSTSAPLNSNQVNENTNTVAQMNQNAEMVSANTNASPATPTGKKSPLTTTANAPQGCTWEEAIFSSVRFLKHNCPAEPYTFTQEGNAIYSGSERSFPVMAIFTKNTGETNVDAVKRLASASAAKPQNCEVIKANYGERAGVERYEYGQTEAAQKEFMAANPDSGWFMNDDCGVYGRTNAVQYFEFQEGQNDFFYMRAGQDTPGIDLDTIEIGMNN